MGKGLNIVHRTGRKSAKGLEVVVVMENEHSAWPILGIYFPTSGRNAERVEKDTLYMLDTPEESLAAAINDAEKFQCDIYGPFM